jgi:hypothetical protein
VTVPVAYSPTVSPAMRGTAELLAQPLRTQGRGDRHKETLALSAVLLDHGVQPTELPALVADVAHRAGWDVEHHRKNAEDSVQRASMNLGMRRDVLPGTLLAVERIFNVPVPDDVLPIDEVSKRLFRAIFRAPDGVSVIVAACGIGKSEQARRVAIARSRAQKKRSRRTVISAPTNDLAKEYVERLRAEGAKVLRVFGPTSLPGEHDGYECRFRKAAASLSNGGQSVRWNLCDGRGHTPCEHRDECKAYEGQEGDEGAEIIIGNHGLLGELDGRAGKSGLLVLDEPPSVMGDEVLSLKDLTDARKHLDAFIWEHAGPLGDVIDTLVEWLPNATLRETISLNDVITFELDVVELLTDERGTRHKVPTIHPSHVSAMRTAHRHALNIGHASKVLRAVCWALRQDDVVAAVYEATDGTRYLALTGMREDLADVLRRDGRVVLMAADADLFAPAYERVVGVDVPVTRLRARDGCAVRRVNLWTTNANRKNWLALKRSPAGALSHAIDVALEHTTADKVLVVTFKAMAKQVTKLVPPGVVVKHYGAMRGLDGFKGFGAVITLGDYLVNVDHVHRTGVGDDLEARSTELCAAELEQAHGRLRTVHRSSSCVQVHVGRVTPRGWPEDVERVLVRDGRPRGVRADTGALGRAIKAAGGVSAAAREMGVSRAMVRHWVQGKRAATQVVTDFVSKYAETHA